MKIAVLYNDTPENAALEERDVLVQRDAVAAALSRMGHEIPLIPCTLNLEATRSRLTSQGPDLAFNLVEALGGTDRMAPAATLLLETLGLPFTGSSTAALLATNDKLGAKQKLLDAGLPTPAWYEDRWCGGSPFVLGQAWSRSCELPAGIDESRPRAIIKAVWEHASFGMDDDAVISLTPATDLDELLQSRVDATGKQHFMEQFVEGREFNLSILGAAGNPQVLPPAEIDFGAFPAGKPNIVGYRAKWDADSFEYHHTPRRFEFPPQDEALLEQLCELAARCWDEFGLRGYARVDFRVDRAGQPWILEVNANPCLAPDAGFAAAIESSGMEYDRAIQQIVEDALFGASSAQRRNRVAL